MNTGNAFEDIRQRLVHARACDEIWWLIEGTHPERETIKDGCNQYVDFFQTIRPSMFISFIILVSSLFDRREDCITLKTIPEFKDDPAFEELWSRGRRLYTYRSKAIAHRAIQNDSEDFAAATGFTLSGVRAILADTISLHDRIAKSQNRIEISDISISPKEDLLDLLRRLSIADAHPVAVVNSESLRSST